jgi:hypothetical protein
MEQAQLDELWIVVLKKNISLSSWEKMHTKYGDTWIWTVVNAVHKFVLVFMIGDRKETQGEGSDKAISGHHC